jgi:hypothetical protein
LVVQDAAEDFLVAEAPFGQELALFFVGDQVDGLAGGGASGCSRVRRWAGLRARDA